MSPSTYANDPSWNEPPPGYAVTLRDRTVETVETADAFAHEKVMTTFYRTANTRGSVDCWSVPLASFRTDEILMIRRLEGATTATLAAIA